MRGYIVDMWAILNYVGGLHASGFGFGGGILKNSGHPGSYGYVMGRIGSSGM